MQVRARRLGSWWMAAAAVVVAAVAPPALGAPPRGRDPAEEAKFTRDIEAIDPALAATFHEATAALDARRFAEARAGFEKVLARVPDHSPTLRRLSYALTGTGDHARALELARRARALLPDRDGDFAVASALLGKAEKGRPDDEAADLANRLLSGSPRENDAALVASIAMRRNDLAMLGNAVEVLERLAPDDLGTNYIKTIYFAASDDLGKADAALDRAVAAGLPPAVAAKIREETGISRQRLLKRSLRSGGVVLAAWVLGLLLLFVAGRLLSAAALRAIERHAADRGDALVTAVRSWRRLYAGAIGACAVYYYASIPILIALVLGGVGLALYGILLAGWIPIKLVALLVIGALLTVWALARSLFARRAVDGDPGRRLPEAEAPALWALLRKVAGDVGTRPVDEVFLTPGTEIAVTEQGSMVARLRDRGRRRLILGVGTLPGLTQRQMSAVLAHEYGHFSNRDTAGGDVAGAVRASLLTAVVRMGGAASAINPAWQFLRVFFGLFQRVTLGASRLQEVLADRQAAVVYGGAAFAEGLRHVVRRSVEFSAEADASIQRAQAQRQAIANLYVPPAAELVNRGDVEANVAKAMADPGSPFDSHPPVERRIAWVAAFETPPGAPADGAAWALFGDQAAIEGEMTGVVNKRLYEADLIE